MKKNKIVIRIFLIFIFCGLIIYFWEDPNEDLGDGYYYLPKYEAMDVGYPHSIIYKSFNKNVFNDIIIEGDVLHAIANKDFILAVQRLETEAIGYAEFLRKNKLDNKNLNYFIIVKSSDSVYGPYVKDKYLQKCKELGVPETLKLKW